MNFEHLCKLVALNPHRLKDKKTTKKFIKYQYEVLNIKKNKLKLGSVAFDLIETTFSGVLLRQDIEIRYTRQDNTEKDELKIENRLKALNWKWDFSNIMAFLIIFTVLIIFLIACAYVWYCNNLPEFAYKNPKYDILVERSLHLTMVSSTLSSLKFLIRSNITLVDYMVALCTFFNVLF